MGWTTGSTPKASRSVGILQSSIKEVLIVAVTDSRSRSIRDVELADLWSIECGEEGNENVQNNF